MHKCTDADKFFEAKESQATWIENAKPSLFCLDNPKRISVYGNAGYPLQKMIDFRLRKCSGENCKSDEEMLEFVEQLSIVIIHNQQTYMPDLYTEDSIRKTLTGFI